MPIPSRPLVPENFTDAITAVRERYLAEGHSLWDIGNGLCENFASDVLDIVIGNDWPMRETSDARGWHTLDTLCLLGAPDTEDDQAETWGWDLLERIYGIEMPIRERPAHDAILKAFPTHIWIWFQGRHYDCEHPQGVESFFDLNFFRRHLGKPDIPA